MTAHDPDLRTDLRKDLDAALQTRKELGPDYEAALVDGFLEKIDEKIDGAIDRRVRRNLAEQQMATARGVRPRPGEGGHGTFGERFGFAAISLVLAIPLSAIAAVNAQLPGLIVCWAGIVGVNALNVTGFLPRPNAPRADE